MSLLLVFIEKIGPTEKDSFPQTYLDLCHDFYLSVLYGKGLWIAGEDALRYFLSSGVNFNEMHCAWTLLICVWFSGFQPVEIRMLSGRLGFLKNYSPNQGLASNFVVVL